MTAISGIHCAITLFTIIALSDAFYLPTSYERYMDEKQAVFQALLAEVAQRQATPSNIMEPTSMSTVTSAASPPKLQEEYPVAPLVPRRGQRNFFFAPQYKRMRPCFYSPIQCLMKR